MQDDIGDRYASIIMHIHAAHPCQKLFYELEKFSFQLSWVNKMVERIRNVKKAGKKS